MNWDQIEGKWMQVKGDVKQKWGNLTDDDLDFIAGQRDELLGKLQERYGIAREEAKRQAQEWLKTLDDESASGTHSNGGTTAHRR
ncbi:MAG TPA: CsbD family protein [Bryobacteraceae bacterium]|jgi:uncharacterized protein YjbJ (UPF0337 family)